MEFKQVQSNRTYQELSHFGICLINLTNKVNNKKFHQIIEINKKRNLFEDVKFNLKYNLIGQHLSNQSKIKNQYSFKLFEKFFFLLLILSISFTLTTSQSININQSKNFSTQPITILYRNTNSSHLNTTDHQFIGNKLTHQYPFSNSIKNVPLHSISTNNNDHNFDLLTINQSKLEPTYSSSVLLNKLINKKIRSISTYSKVFNESDDNHSVKLKSNKIIMSNNDFFSNGTDLNSASSFYGSSLDQHNKSYLDQNIIFSSLPLILAQNESNNTIPDQIYIDILKNTRFWVQRIASPLIIAIGVIGNSMTIVIMTRKRMRSSTNVYLAALATVDMLYLTFTFILSLKHYPGITQPTTITRLYWRIQPILMMSADVCTNCSVWLTAAFTIERFIVVSNPIRGKMLCTESRARKLCIFIFAFCTAFVIPVPFEWIIVEKLDKDQKPTLTMIPSDLGRNSTYKSVYYWLTSVLFIFVPLIFLIVFNSFLIRSVHISRKERAHMTNAQPTSIGINKKKKDAKKSKNKQKFTCELQLDANNNDNPTTSPKSGNLEPTAIPNLQSASDSNLQINNRQQNDQSERINNLQPDKNLLTQRRLSDNQNLESRRTSTSSPTAVKNISSTIQSNRIEQQSAKQETKITIMLISVVILFLVCQLPVAINLIYTSIRNLIPDTNEMLIVTALNNILNLMVAVNAAGNFVLYCLLSQKYRKTLVTLFLPCFKRERLRKCNKQQATIYTTLTTTAHYSPSSTTGLQNNKLNNRANLNEHHKRSNDDQSKIEKQNQARE